METSEPETVVPEAEIHNVAVASNKKSAEKKSTTTTTSTAATTKSTSQKLPSAVEFEPPLACVRRILKHALPATTNVGKDASAAFARACGIFIIYVTACANDFARENKRQTITANDVMAAIKELDFDEFTPHMVSFLEKYRNNEKHKKNVKAAAARNKLNPNDAATPQKRTKNPHDDPDDSNNNNNTQTNKNNDRNKQEKTHEGGDDGDDDDDEDDAEEEEEEEVVEETDVDEEEDDDDEDNDQDTPKREKTEEQDSASSSSDAEAESNDAPKAKRLKTNGDSMEDE